MRLSRGAAAILAIITGLAAGTIVAGFGVTLGEDSIPSGLTPAAGSPTGPDGGRPKLDLLHAPPLLVRRGEPVEFRYQLVCPAGGLACAPEGTVYLRTGDSGPFTPVRLRPGGPARQDGWYLQVPRRFLSGSSFSYYAVMRDRTSGLAMTLPAGGSSGPQRAWLLDNPVVADLGTHRFGRPRAPDALVARARWGHADGAVGLDTGREQATVGPSSFDIGADGSVQILDQVNRRLVTYRKGAALRPARTAPVAISGAMADLAMGSDGTAYELDQERQGAATVKAFDASGGARGSVRLPAASPADELRMGPTGPVAHQYPGRDLAADQRGSRRLPERHVAAVGRPLGPAGRHPQRRRPVNGGQRGDRRPRTAARSAGRAGPRNEGAGRLERAQRDEPRRDRPGRAVQRRRPDGGPHLDRDAGGAAGAQARSERDRVQLRGRPGRVGPGAAHQPLPARRRSPPLPAAQRSERGRGGGLDDWWPPMTARNTRRACLLLGVAVVATLWARPAEAAGNFVDRFCNRDPATKVAVLTRAAARSYASVAAGEGYQWGGGCWNDNNRDDQPGDPHELVSTRGEGGDCSGLVFKTWALANDASGADRGFYRRGALTYFHGPFAANAFKTRNLNAFGPVPKASAISMDAFASAHHTGLVYQANANGTDQIVEAIGEDQGTRVATESFRGNPDFSGVRRKGWTGVARPPRPKPR
jgi:hypothetical protein